MKNILGWFLKGFGIGAANVIPGVSGGTIALITGVFERLIDSIKSFDTKAVKLIFTGKYKEFFKHSDLVFLIAILSGAVVSIFTFARLLDYLFKNYEVYVWAFFFGLIIASVYFVLNRADKINFRTIFAFVAGASIAFIISFLNPATENDATYYLIICGMIAIISMILPGLSGSFMLILLGNYQLVMIDSVNTMNFNILIPVGIGVVIALPLFSRALSWIYKKYRNETLAILAGFILGSLRVLWPWKTAQYLKDSNGVEILNKRGEYIIHDYIRFIPEKISLEVLLAVALAVAGVLAVWLIERAAYNEKTPDIVESNKN